MFPCGIQKHPGLRLAASAPRLVLVRTVIDCVQPRASSLKLATHPRVQGFQLICRDEALGDTTLIACHHDKESSLIEQPHSIEHAGKKLHLFPPRHILPFRSFSVDHSVAIEKHSLLHEISSALPVPR